MDLLVVRINEPSEFFEMLGEGRLPSQFQPRWRELAHKAEMAPGTLLSLLRRRQLATWDSVRRVSAALGAIVKMSSVKDQPVVTVYEFRTGNSYLSELVGALSEDIPIPLAYDPFTPDSQWALYENGALVGLPRDITPY